MEKFQFGNKVPTGPTFSALPYMLDHVSDSVLLLKHLTGIFLSEAQAV